MRSEINRFPKILILFFLTTFATFLGLLFTPALPEISEQFQVSSAVSNYTMSIFLVGYAIGQLPYGPLANRFGRKKAISIGAFIALTGSLLAYFSEGFWVLVFARFIQALGSSVGLKVAFTMIADRYTGSVAAKTVSTMTIAFGFMPGLATAIGGFVTVYAGWRGCFLTLIIYTVLLWFMTRLLPETAKELHPYALQPKKLYHGFANQFKDLYIVSHAALAGLTTAIIYIFSAIAPYIGIVRIGLSPDEYGVWALVPSLGFFVGSLLSRKMSHLNARLKILSGILIIFFGSAIISLSFANQIINVWTLFIPTFIISIGNIFIWSNALAHGISGATDKSNASAVMQFINISVATIGVFIVQLFKPTATMLFPGVLAIAIALLLLLWMTLKAHHHHQ